MQTLQRLSFAVLRKARCSQPSKSHSAETDADDLEALLDSYDQAARADKQAIERTQKKDKKPSSMKELRTEGLNNPLTAENRSGFIQLACPSSGTSVH